MLSAAASLPLALGFERGGPDQDLAGTPPYALPSASGRTPAGGPWDPASDLHGSAALVYVSERCPFCRRELAHWATLAAAGEVTPLWIVASPGSVVSPLDWVPPALRDRVVWDAEGAIAAALGVRAVPATLWVDDTGIVRAQRLGESSAGTIRNELRSHVAGPGTDLPGAEGSAPPPTAGGSPGRGRKGGGVSPVREPWPGGAARSS